MRNFVPALLLSLGISFGLLGAGYMVSKSRVADRFVEVKGLSEQVIKSDYASWKINYTSSGMTLVDAIAQIEKNQLSVIDFLKKKGFEDSEIEKGQIKITDKDANPYTNNNQSGPRYIIDASITIRTTKVDALVAASQQTLELAKSGVVLGGDYYTAPRYEFKGLDKLKPQMIADATKDARRAADQFAKDSGAKVAQIRRATQGYFSIEPLDATQEGGSSLYQKIRVVSTIEFFFE